MTGTELEQRLVALGFSQRQFARLMGTTPRAVGYWIAGKRQIQDRQVNVIVPSYVIFAVQAMERNKRVLALALQMSKG